MWNKSYLIHYLWILHEKRWMFQLILLLKQKCAFKLVHSKLLLFQKRATLYPIYTFKMMIHCWMRKRTFKKSSLELLMEISEPDQQFLPNIKYNLITKVQQIRSNSLCFSAEKALRCLFEWRVVMKSLMEFIVSVVCLLNSFFHTLLIITEIWPQEVTEKWGNRRFH